MTTSFQASSYPFGVMEEERKSIVGGPGVRNSMMSVHSSRNSDSDSFVSAIDSPSAI